MEIVGPTIGFSRIICVVIDAASDIIHRISLLNVDSLNNVTSHQVNQKMFAI